MASVRAAHSRGQVDQRARGQASQSLEVHWWLDATRVLVRNGPQGGNIDDAKDLHQVAAGLDPVAIDVYGAGLIGIPFEQIRYLRIAEERGLGHRDLAAISIAYV